LIKFSELSLRKTSGYDYQRAKALTAEKRNHIKNIYGPIKDHAIGSALADETVQEHIYDQLTLKQLIGSERKTLKKLN